MIAGRYSLDREIGRGGMGAVWLGTDEVLGRAVALKKLGMMPGSDSPDVARAEREARLAAMLNHPHVVAVYDLAADGDETWLVMEHVDGESLSQRLARGPLPAAEAVPLARQCAEALHAAHGAGIVHRDVKPSNIMVTRDGQAKLTDFGIARATADPSLTQTGLVTGSPAYLAPEVASGQSATPASDVWSLGATIYHVLAGRPPYDVGDNIMGGLFRIVHEDPPRLPDAGPLGTLLEGMMTKEPADRWSMEQVRDHLRELSSGGAPTQMMAPVPVPQRAPAEEEPTTVAQPVPPVEHTRPPAPAPPPAEGGPRREHSRRTWMLIPVALLAVLLLGIWLVTSGGDDDTAPAADDTSQTPDQSASETSDSPSKSPSKSKPDKPSPAETEAQMEQFITDYLATAPQDSRATFQQLTPAFQEDSGFYEGYDGFWSTIESASVSAVSADAKSLVVTYTVDYVKTDGSQSSDDVQLQLVRSGEGFQIDSEA